VGDASWFAVAAWDGGVPSWPEAVRSGEPWCADGIWCAAPFCDGLSCGGESCPGAVLGGVVTDWGADAKRVGAALVDGVDGPFSFFASLSP